MKAIGCFCAAATGLALGLFTDPAAAQNLPTPTQAIDAPPVEHLFGDWGGVQTSLLARGINLQVNLIAEPAGNVTGGTRQGATSANQVGVDFDINWERLAGLTGLSTHAFLVNRSGSSDSALFGDYLPATQEIYGLGGDVGVHLASVYGEETLLNGRVDIAAGRMIMTTDFAASALYCAYMNNDLCGDPHALALGDIAQNAPIDAEWAARLHLKPTSQTILKVGVYEVNQGLYNYKFDRTGFEFNTSQDSGVYVPVEFDWEPTFGPDLLPGHYKLGFGYDTSPGHQDFGNVLAADGVPGFGRKIRSGNTQIWVLADQMLIRNGKGDGTGLIALAGFIHNEANNTSYAKQYFSGLIDSGFWAKRPKDSIAVLLTYIEISPRLVQVQNVEQALGLPISDNATAPQSHEVLFEINYRAPIYRGVSIQPDFQYIFRPNAQTTIRDAAVLGARLYVEF